MQSYKEMPSARKIFPEIFARNKNPFYLCTTIGNNATNGEVGEWLKPPVC